MSNVSIARRIGDKETADCSSGSTEGCDDVDDMDDDDDDVSMVSRFVADRGQSAGQHQQPQQTHHGDSEVTRLANITRDCAVFMTDFVQKIFDPS